MLDRLISIHGPKGYVLSFLLGALSVLGHAPFYLWPITLICFALLMLRLDGAREQPRPTSAGFWTGLAFGFGYFLFGLYWIGSAFLARGSGFVIIMPFAIALFSMGLALFWAFASLIYVRLSSASLWRIGLFGGLFFATEFARGHILSGFPWNLPGYIFPAGGPISQIASYIGIYGLSAFVFFFAAFLAAALYNRNFLPFGIGLVVLSGAYVYGSALLLSAPIEQTQYVQGAKLRIVHANISQKDKLDQAKYVQNVNRYLQLSMSKGFEEVTHIIWPEGAVPGAMFETPVLISAIENLFRSRASTPPVLIAQTGRTEQVAGAATPRYYNSAAAMSFLKNGEVQSTPFYDKQKLVPFGEFFPGGKIAQKLGLKTLSSALFSMTAGRLGFVPSLPGLPPASIQICYEIIFPGFTPKILQPSGLRPEWILNLSNDSWYGNSTGPRQHVNQVRYRAIEEGLPIVRSTSGGISGVIDAYGRQIVSINLDEEGALDVQLPRYVHKYAYKKPVGIIILLLNFFILIVCYAGIQRAR